MDFLVPHTKRIPRYIVENYKGGSKFRNGDSLVARITPCLENGKTSFVDILERAQVGFGSTEFIVLREKPQVTDKHYLYYLAVSDDFRDVAVKSMTGTSGRQRVVTDEILRYKFFLPELLEQKAIAEVLSSLDDKIDLLHRQNKTLEAMAQIAFQGRFKKRTNTEWEKKPLSYFGDVICGKTPSKKVHEYFGGSIPFIKIPDMHDKTFVFDTDDTLTDTGKNSQNIKTLPSRSICVSCIATVGLVSMNAFESQTNQQINSIIPVKDEYRYYIYLFMKSSKNMLKAMASGGTATMNLNTGNFSNIMIPITSEKLFREFDDCVKPLFEKIFFNQSQIRILENLRDALLPKLMSGKVKLIPAENTFSA